MSGAGAAWSAMPAPRPRVERGSFRAEPVAVAGRARSSRRGGDVPSAPAGTRRGYDDLRRAAAREHIGHGLRPSVASVADLARMTAALGRETIPSAFGTRRIMEVEARLPRTLGIEP